MDRACKESYNEENWRNGTAWKRRTGKPNYILILLRKCYDPAIRLFCYLKLPQERLLCQKYSFHVVNVWPSIDTIEVIGYQPTCFLFYLSFRLHSFFIYFPIVEYIFFFKIPHWYKFLIIIAVSSINYNVLHDSHILYSTNRQIWRQQIFSAWRVQHMY